MPIVNSSDCNSSAVIAAVKFKSKLYLLDRSN